MPCHTLRCCFTLRHQRRQRQYALDVIFIDAAIRLCSCHAMPDYADAASDADACRAMR